MFELKNQNVQILCLVAFSALISVNTLKSQTNEHLFLGKIVSNSGKTPVNFALVVNSASKGSAIADSSGFFSIRVSLGDTLQVSRIGYYNEKLVVSGAHLLSKKIQIIELNERVYELSGVNISPFGSYQEFKNKVINSELPKKEEINPSLRKTFSEEVVVLQPQASISLGSPVTALYMLLSKEGKSLRKLAKEEEKDKLEASYKNKYSPQIVSQLTGLKDLELEKFMKYCNVSVSFIEASTEYDIAEKVLQCFKNYKAGSNVNTLDTIPK